MERALRGADLHVQHPAARLGDVHHHRQEQFVRGIAHRGLAAEARLRSSADDLRQYHFFLIEGIGTLASVRGSWSVRASGPLNSSLAIATQKNNVHQEAKGNSQ
jgi:hypothetical protein